MFQGIYKKKIIDDSSALTWFIGYIYY